MTLLFKIVFLAGVLVVASKPFTEEERLAMFTELIGNCKAKEGASDNDVQEAIEHKPPTTQQGRCFNACMMENLGIMVNSKLSVEGSIKIAEMTGDATKVKNSEAVSLECQSVGGGDRCDSVAEIMQCVEQACAKLGIDPAKDLH
ncbi:General odorant-binding protein 28a [Pseudolycoriella hygida]|uniref:General odorant-binding protein 28a n=1 Tax=Pseudolycoriella hygida TaxID=35572 RepID=A0A9Q0MM52_9DIPT|nr:General odorant-binding protein 28a [Pseudolycoriella hygida]